MCTGRPRHSFIGFPTLTLLLPYVFHLSLSCNLNRFLTSQMPSMLMWSVVHLASATKTIGARGSLERCSEQAVPYCTQWASTSFEGGAPPCCHLPWQGAPSSPAALPHALAPALSLNVSMHVYTVGRSGSERQVVGCVNESYQNIRARMWPATGPGRLDRPRHRAAVRRRAESASGSLRTSWVA